MTSKKIGRPANTGPTPPAAVDPTLDQGKIEGAMAHMRGDLQAQRADEDLQLAQAAQMVGGALMARLHKEFSRAAEVRMFQQLRALPLAVVRRVQAANFPELPATAGKKAGNPGELPATAGNLETLCPLVFGRTYSVLLEEEKTFAALGEASYEVAARLGLNRAALRAARTLPPEKLEVVRIAIADGSSKAEVLSVIEDLAEQVEVAQAALSESKAEHAADRELLEKKNAKIDTLEKRIKRISKLPPDEALAELKKEATAIATNAEGVIVGELRQALIAVKNHGDEDHTVFMAGLVGQAQARLTALRAEFGLPDVSNAADARLVADMAEWDKP